MPHRTTRHPDRVGRPSIDSIELRLSMLRTQRWTGAFDIHHSAMAVHEAASQAGDPLLEAEAITLLGRSYAPMIFPLQSLELLRRAESIFLANGNIEWAAVSRVMQARAEFEAGRDLDAIDSAQQALEVSSLPVDHRISAWLCIGLSRGHLGDIGAAIDIVDTEAIPLLRLDGTADITPHALRVAAALRLHHRLAVQTPQLWRGLPLVESETPKEFTTAEVLDLLHQARRAMPEGVVWPFLDMTELLADGLEHEAAAATAVRKLQAFAADYRRRDPPAACWARSCASLLLAQQKARKDALDEIEGGLALARTYELRLFIGDATLQQARLLEDIGESKKALDTYKAAWNERIEGLRSRGEPARALAGHPVSAPASTVASAPRHVQPTSVRCAVRFIDLHLSGRIAISDIVAFCSVGRRSLENAFKQAHGMTLQQYIRAQRLQRATQLLLDTRLSIAEVARSTGFGTASSFTRDFVRQKGVTPYRFRQART